MAEDEARDFSAGIPGSRLKIYERLGHLINVEAPDEFIGDVVDFLS